MTETLAPTFDAIWQAQVEDAVTRLVDDPAPWLTRLERDPSAGLELSRTVAEHRGWHSLHPFTETVLDRVNSAVRALRDGQDTDLDPTDLAALRQWSSEDGYWSHVLTAAAYADDFNTLLALRYQRGDLMAAAALARSPALGRLLDGDVLQATVSDPALLSEHGVVIEVEPGVEETPPEVTAAPEGLTVGHAARRMARGLFGDDGGPCGLLVIPVSTSGPVYLLGEQARLVVVQGDAAVAAVTRLFGPGERSRDGDLVVLRHPVDGATSARLLFGSDPGRHFDVAGFRVVAIADGGSGLAALVNAVRGVPDPGVAPLRLHPRRPTDVEEVSYRWASLTGARPGSPDVESLRTEAASVGIDLDLWTVARAGQDSRQAYADLVEAVGERLGWRPIPAEVLETATAVFNGVLGALRGDGVIPAGELSRLSGWAERPGFWAKLSHAGMRTEDGVVFPFPATACDLLRTAVECGGDPSAMEARIGPLQTLAIRQMEEGDLT